MAINFNSGLLGVQQQRQGHQRLIEKLLPGKDTRKANTQEDWVNDIYKCLEICLKLKMENYLV